MLVILITFWRIALGTTRNKAQKMVSFADKSTTIPIVCGGFARESCNDLYPKQKNYAKTASKIWQEAEQPPTRIDRVGGCSKNVVVVGNHPSIGCFTRWRNG